MKPIPLPADEGHLRWVHAQVLARLREIATRQAEILEVQSKCWHPDEYRDGGTCGVCGAIKVIASTDGPTSVRECNALIEEKQAELERLERLNKRLWYESQHKAKLRGAT